MLQEHVFEFAGLVQRPLTTSLMIDHQSLEKVHVRVLSTRRNRTSQRLHKPQLRVCHAHAYKFGQASAFRLIIRFSGDPPQSRDSEQQESVVIKIPDIGCHVTVRGEAMHKTTVRMGRPVEQKSPP